jgi:hypothetical protein
MDETPPATLAMLVNEPHSVGVATMVSVKGWSGVKKRLPVEHVTVFPLVLHPPGSESTVNPDGNWSTMGKKSMQPEGLKGHLCVMVKMIGSPTSTVLGVAVLSITQVATY